MAKTNMKIKFSEWPKYSKFEIAEASKVIKSGKVNYWTGSKCTEFEELYKKKFKLNYAISVANGSVALDAAVSVLNLTSKDEVIVTSRSYVSTASCLQSTKAKVIFADVDLNSQNISIQDLSKKISIRTKAIICTHLAGWPANILEIKKIINNKKIKIIEDCSQAHGARIQKKYVGSFGDIAVWSFCNDKIISTLGEGGMIACKDRILWKKLWAYKDCGKNYDKIFQKKKNNLFKWVHDYKGTNLRMTEVQAAVGIIQLKKLENMINKRKFNCDYIWKNIKKNNFIFVPKIDKDIFHSGYRCYLTTKNNKIRNNLIKYLNQFGIDANQGSCPEIYKERRFYNKQQKSIFLKNANKLGKISISLPSHHLISKKQLLHITSTINDFINNKIKIKK